jgi:integral membrane protein
MSERHTATLRQLNVIRWVAALDFCLLIPLVIAALKDADGVVSILGPIHGTGFVILLALCIRGWSEDRWGLWFPALVVVTLGPPGSLIGERRIRREIDG